MEVVFWIASVLPVKGEARLLMENAYEGRGEGLAEGGVAGYGGAWTRRNANDGGRRSCWGCVPGMERTS